MTVAVEAVACLLCGSAEATEVLTGPDRLLGLPGTFRFVKCLSCGLIRQNPRPVTTLDLYPDSYPSHRQSPSNRLSLRAIDLRYGQRKRVRTVQAHASGGTLLDVGCGSGDFLAAMRQAAGWRVVGIEPVERAWRLCQSLGLDVIHGTLEQAALPDHCFDAITMWNVLEHVPDPVAALSEARRLIKPEGVLIAAVPVEEGRLRERFGSFWVEWDLPRHMHIFSRRTLGRLFESTGFRSLAAGAPLSEYRVWRMSLELWARERVHAPTLQQIVPALAAFLPVRIAMTLWLRATTPQDRASVQVFVARAE